MDRNELIQLRSCVVGATNHVREAIVTICGLDLMCSGDSRSPSYMVRGPTSPRGDGEDGASYQNSNIFDFLRARLCG